jgi:hypothetical protein
MIGPRLLFAGERLYPRSLFAASRGVLYPVTANELERAATSDPPCIPTAGLSIYLPSDDDRTATSVDVEAYGTISARLINRGFTCLGEGYSDESIRVLADVHYGWTTFYLVELPEGCSACATTQWRCVGVILHDLRPLVEGSSLQGVTPEQDLR